MIRLIGSAKEKDHEDNEEQHPLPRLSKLSSMLYLNLFGCRF